MGHVRRPDAGPLVVDGQRGPAAVGTDGHGDPAVGGLWRIALSTRIITSCRRRAGSPVTTAGCGSTSTWTPRSDAGLVRADAPSAATSPRSTGRCSSSMAPESDRASRSRSFDDRGHVADLVVDVLERGADLADRLGLVARQVLDAAPDHGERGAELVTAVGREVALSAKGRALVAERLADRDERPARVHEPEPKGDEDDDEAADQQHRQHHAQRPLLSRPVLDDLDREDVAVPALGRLRQDPDWRAPDLGRADVAPGRRGGGDGGRLGQARWHPRLGPADRLPVGPQDQRERARAGAAEAEPVRREVVGVGRLPGDDRRLRASSWASPELASDRSTATYRMTPRTTSTTSVVRPLHSTRLRRTPRTRPASAASAARSWSVASLGVVVVVRHRPCDTRCRGRSRSVARRRRASRAGSGCRRRPHSGSRPR